jgi:hypothetical protein
MRNSPQDRGLILPKPVDVYSGLWRDGGVTYSRTVRAKQKPTLRPSAPEVTPQSLRALASEMRADASRMLARANDLDLAAKRLEGE